MHKDMSGTDFHLVCEGSPLPAHRLVLAAASPYFKAMLITDTAEAKAGRTNLGCSEERGFENWICGLYALDAVGRKVCCGPGQTPL